MAGELLQQPRTCAVLLSRRLVLHLQWDTRAFQGVGIWEGICLCCSAVANVRGWVPELSGQRYMPTAWRMSWQWELLCSWRKNSAFAAPGPVSSSLLRAGEQGFLPHSTRVTWNLPSKSHVPFCSPSMLLSLPPLQHTFRCFFLFLLEVVKPLFQSTDLCRSASIPHC